MEVGSAFGAGQSLESGHLRAPALKYGGVGCALAPPGGGGRKRGLHNTRGRGELLKKKEKIPCWDIKRLTSSTTSMNTSFFRCLMPSLRQLIFPVTFIEISA